MFIKKTTTSLESLVQDPTVGNAQKSFCLKFFFSTWNGWFEVFLMEYSLGILGTTL